MPSIGAVGVPATAMEALCTASTASRGTRQGVSSTAAVMHSNGVTNLTTGVALSWALH